MGRQKPSRKKSPETKKQSRWGFRGMTVRDWLQLLIVPLALVVIGFLFTMQQDARQQQIEDARARQAQKIENQRAESEREIEEQRAQDAALQAYLDQMSQLMLEGDLRSSEEGSEVRTLARARTRTVLTRLDSRRKGSVVQFLYEASLINKERPVVSLSGVSLRGADLSGLDLRGADLINVNVTDTDLSGADLSEADLSEADLIRADLSWAVLSSADLSGAVLSDAYLYSADLSGANLIGAELKHADLRGAILHDADLSDAYLIRSNLIDAELWRADLSGADLRDAKGVTEEELEEQAKTLEGATMPDRSTYD
jgi:uncharacterized protein YjbI with pentapeptide repeats